jgi:hypothetical protein
MLLTWMAYSVLFGALTFGAALAVERAAETWNRSRRFVWIAALIIAASVPVVFAIQPRAAEPIVTAPAGAEATSTASDVVVSFGGGRRAPHEPLFVRARRIAARSDGVALNAWMLASLCCIALLLRATIGIRRRQERWQSADIDGVPVLVAADVGPAVVGALSPRIVIPHWAASLDAQARALMLRHEAEHIRARDPLCLHAATLVTAMLPWNAALWMIVRRLRLAIEIDCDQRVLRASSERREYGELLLTVGARLSAPMPFATSLAERRPFLERRLRAMTALSPRHPRIVTAGCVALVIVATTAATRVPRPSPFGPRVAAAAVTPVAPIAAATDSRLSATATSVPPATVTPSRTPRSGPLAFSTQPAVASLPVDALPVPNPDSLTVAEIRGLIEAHHPTVMSGDPSINTITLVVDARGNYVVSLAESRPLRMDAVVGRGGRGRGAGAAPTMVGGGDTAFARGRVGGRGAAAARPVDSALAVSELRALAQKLREAAAGDTSAARRDDVAALRAKIEKAYGDSMILRSDARLIVTDGIVQRDGPAPMSDDQIKTAGTRIGMNMDALSRLIEPQSIERIQIQTFPEGQIGPMMLRVFVVHQRP